jgi:hypothetical protein
MHRINSNLLPILFIHVEALRFFRRQGIHSSPSTFDPRPPRSMSLGCGRSPRTFFGAPFRRSFNWGFLQSRPLHAVVPGDKARNLARECLKNAGFAAPRDAVRRRDHADAAAGAKAITTAITLDDGGRVMYAKITLQRECGYCDTNRRRDYQKCGKPRMAMLRCNPWQGGCTRPPFSPGPSKNAKRWATTPTLHEDFSRAGSRRINSSSEAEKE